LWIIIRMYSHSAPMPGIRLGKGTLDDDYLSQKKYNSNQI